MDALREWFVDWTPAVQALAALVIAGFTVWLATSTKRYADASDAQLEELRSQSRERRAAEGRAAAQALSAGLVRLRERVQVGSCESLEEAFPEWTVVYSTHAPALARAAPELGTRLDECHALIEKDRDDCFYNRAGADSSGKRTQALTSTSHVKTRTKDMVNTLGTFLRGESIKGDGGSVVLPRFRQELPRDPDLAIRTRGSIPKSLGRLRWVL